MQKKFLKEVVVIIVGKQAEDIADLLDSKKHVNEFIIAKKLDITINQTRNILYRLSDYGLVSSIRKKDKKKGWYTYFWKIEILKALEFLRDALQKKIEQFDLQIKSREMKQFYICEKCNIEFNEENALLHNFICNECGEIFSLKNNVKVLVELKRNREKIIKEIKLIDVELDKERINVEKIRLKEIEREKKEKADKRKLATMKRRLEREKLTGKKKPIKKVSKKKVVNSKKKVAKKKPVKKIKAKKKVEKKLVKKVKRKGRK